MVQEYEAIIIGTGSGTNLVEPLLQQHPGGKIAVIDKDPPGGICLTRGCIPSKMLLYPAEVMSTIRRAGRFGIDVQVNRVRFDAVMKRMRDHVDGQIEAIRQSLQQEEQIDYYPQEARFVAPRTLEVGGQRLSSDLIILCTGSRSLIPPIEGLDRISYHTSSTLLHLKELPASLVIIGGGYIAAEYGFFFSAMGSEVTIVGRNPQFLPDEEPEISEVVRRKLAGHLRMVTGHEVTGVEQEGEEIRVTAVNRDRKSRATFVAETVLVATGRAPTTDILQPEKGGIETDRHGWIVTDRHLRTSQPGVWALGDATGRYLFKHVANYESEIVYHNSLFNRQMEVDYHAVPHAVFTDPEVAGVGMGEREAIDTHGKDAIRIGFYRYEDTGKGLAVDAGDYFVKVIVAAEDHRILGAHMVGPWASMLIHEVIPLMYTPDGSLRPLLRAMHIHPAMSEVVQRAAGNLMDVDDYHHLIGHHYGLPFAATG